MHKHNRAWMLMARSLSNEATEAERQELQSLLQQDEHMQQQFAMLREFWVPVTNTNCQPDSKIQRILQKAKQRESDTPSGEVVEMKPRNKFIIWWAAASIIVAAIGFFALNDGEEKHQKLAVANYNDSISTQNGNRSQLILPDGSRVWLNSGSRLLYTKSFAGDVREVQLIGEAFFDVVKMPEKPFIVHAEGINIKVLGTTFNVKCYPKDENVETTLLHGAVSVTHKDDPGKISILLKPNEKLSIKKEFSSAAKAAFAVKEFSIIAIDSTVKPSHLEETAWVYNRLEFKGDDFVKLAEKMERWYNIRIRFTDERVKHLRFIGSFEDETVEQALTALQSVATFTYKIKGNEILINSPD